ncbi:MAG: outer membrane lipoprotein chaperone LolA [Gammaproteobacteria bacterium]|nr:outer membrane lipoprotein chaperone LolA [Gammaproteobacteria bacterium]
MKHKIMRNLFIGLIPVFASCANANAQAVEERLRTFLKDVQSMETKFEQTLFDEKSRRLEDSSGRFYLQRPDRFRWSYTKPYPQEIVADGNRIWIFDSELDQVTVRSMEGALGNTPALLLSSDAPLEDSFTIVTAESLNGLDWVELLPKSVDSSFNTIRLGFNAQALEVMELMDNFGQTTQLRFFATVRNPELPADVFLFEPPEGVDIIE